MFYKLSSSDITTLTDKPETGMGYQVVMARVMFEKVEKIFVVYNSELVIIEDSEFKANKDKFKKEKFASILKGAEPLRLSASIKVLNEDEARNLPSIKEDSFKANEVEQKWHKTYSDNSGALDNPPKNADGKEIFVRVSPYQDDRRIDKVNRKLKPGSFSTTEQDYKDCVANDDPIERYALPSADKIAWAFYIKPITSDNLQRGIVQPAFGRRGGGIEAYFAVGTSANTLFDTRNYGQ